MNIYETIDRIVSKLLLDFPEETISTKILVDPDSFQQRLKFSLGDKSFMKDYSWNSIAEASSTNDETYKNMFTEIYEDLRSDIATIIEVRK